MRRLLVAVSVAGALLILTVPAVFAASPHFKKGGNLYARFPARRAFRSHVRERSLD
jgi:hypothetical protein